MQKIYKNSYRNKKIFIMVDEINENLGKQKIKLTDSIAEYIIVQTERMPLV